MLYLAGNSFIITGNHKEQYCNTLLSLVAYLHITYRYALSIYIINELCIIWKKKKKILRSQLSVCQKTSFYLFFQNTILIQYDYNCVSYKQTHFMYFANKLFNKVSSTCILTTNSHHVYCQQTFSMCFDNKLSPCILTTNIQHVSWQQISSCILPTHIQHVSWQQTLFVYFNNKLSTCIMKTNCLRVSWQKHSSCLDSNSLHISWQHVSWQQTFNISWQQLSSCILPRNIQHVPWQQHYVSCQEKFITYLDSKPLHESCQETFIMYLDSNSLHGLANKYSTYILAVTLCILPRNIHHVSWQQISSCILTTIHSTCILTANLFMYLAHTHSAFILTTNSLYVSWQQNIQHVS